MLEELLRLVAEGGTYSYEDLMRHLSVSQPMLEVMLEDLARIGYLRSVGDGCEGRCQACPMGGCSVTGPGCLWVLTDRGARAAARFSL
jgi:hypothetical protein